MIPAQQHGGPGAGDRGPKQIHIERRGQWSVVSGQQTSMPGRGGGVAGSDHGPRTTDHAVRRSLRNLARGAAPAVFGASLVLAAACASSAPPDASVGTRYREEGLASWYGEPYHGRQTASGPRYDMNEMTAAHRTLPFGTLVRVKNLENGKRTTVLINDRGPFVDGRIIDLSRAAAAALGSIGPGVVRVRLEVEREGDGMLSAPCWEVQVGAFAVAANAERARGVLASRSYAVRLAPAGGGLVRVRVTGVGNRDQALAVSRHLAPDYPGAVAVPCGGWS